MLYLYDNALVDDLSTSFKTDLPSPVIRVISPDRILDLAAQIQDDQISFPVVALDRSEDIKVDNQRQNFTRAHFGTPAAFDKHENNIYNERAIPVELSYILTVLTTNQIDMDEIMRELIFKYTSMYFLSITAPYESKRDISFGVVIDSDFGIQRKSGSSEYSESGKLYQSSISLRCEGCVLLHYTPRHLKRGVIDLDVQ